MKSKLMLGVNPKAERQQEDFYAPSFYICPHNESKFIMPFNDNILVEKNTCYEIIGNIYESGHLLGNTDTKA